MKPNFHALPKREYCNGDTKMTSLRLPEPLMNELKKISSTFGWNTSDVIVTALDQYVQWAKTGKKSK